MDPNQKRRVLDELRKSLDIMADSYGERHHVRRGVELSNGKFTTLMPRNMKDTEYRYRVVDTETYGYVGPVFTDKAAAQREADLLNALEGL